MPVLPSTPSRSPNATPPRADFDGARCVPCAPVESVGTLRLLAQYCVALTDGDSAAPATMLRSVMVAEVVPLLLAAAFVGCTPLVEALCVEVQHLLRTLRHGWEAQLALLGTLSGGRKVSDARQAAYRVTLTGMTITVPEDDTHPVACPMPAWRYSGVWHQARAGVNIVAGGLRPPCTPRLQRRAMLMGKAHIYTAPVRQ